jgi:hypothetical protein
VAQFTTRVELHDAKPADYDKLHIEMAKQGFARTVVGVDSSGASRRYHLPSAEYDSQSIQSCEQVRNLAKATADAVRSGAWVLVTEVASRSWNLVAVSSAKAA